MSGRLVGALLGLVLGSGLWLVLSGVPWLRPVTLVDRVDPYVGVGRRGRSGRPGRLGAAWHGFVAGGGALVGRFGAGGEALQARLLHAGRGDVDRYRAEQLAWAAAGLGLGGVLSGVLRWQRSSAPVALVVLVLAAGASAVLARDQLLAAQVRRRQARLLAELPVVAELLALAVGAGEGPVPALARVARLTRGELSADLAATLAEARTGVRLERALHGLADRTGLVAVRRFVDGMVVAMERGTPLAEVLRAQAADVRQLRHRTLLDTAGRKEIAMMVPIVFAVLPVTVLFAVYPGVAFLRLGGP